MSAANDAVTTDDPAAADGEPRLAPIPASLRLPLIALWLLWFALGLLVQGFGLWLAFQELEPLDLLMLNGTGLTAATVLFIAAALLVRRNPGDSVAYLLSMSFLSAASYVGTAPYTYGSLELGFLGTILPSLWLGFMVAALPAFPDGRYVPRWGRWLTLLAIPFTLAISADTFFENESVILGTTLLGFAIGIAAVATSIIRFWRTPVGLPRQQMKWAALGFSAGILLLILSVAVVYVVEAELFPEDWLAWVPLLYYALHDTGFALTALGFLVAQMRFRLWDADRVIGRSAAYFILTLILACVWAVSAALVNDFVSFQVGGSNKGMVAAISTIIAALVFGPAREKVGKWVEKRLQRGVVQLRKLPERLAIWQHLDDPEAFGARVAGAIGDSLHAGRSAVLLFEQGQFRPLACVGIAPEEVQAWMADAGSFGELDYEQPSDETFPLRLILTDEEVLIGALLIGRRSDGSFFAKEERKTLHDLEPALAAALNRVHTKVTTNRALAGIDQRLERVEEAVGAAH